MDSSFIPSSMEVEIGFSTSMYLIRASMHDIDIETWVEFGVHIMTAVGSGVEERREDTES